MSDDAVNTPAKSEEAATKYNPYFWERSSTAYLDELFGVNYFAHDWIFPSDFSREDFLEYIKRDEPFDLLFMNRINDSIQRLNPDLATVKRTKNSYKLEYHFLAGAHFKFPADDVNFFINDWQAMDNKARDKHREATHLHLQTYPPWIMSPKSLDRIKVVKTPDPKEPFTP